MRNDTRRDAIHGLRKLQKRIAHFFMPVVLLGLSACGNPSPSAGEQFFAAEDAARQRYQAQYDELILEDAETIVQRLEEIRGPPWTPRPATRAPLVDAPLPSELDPTLSLLLADPKRMAALDLARPRKFAPGIDPRELFGRYRCDEKDYLRTEIMGTVAGTRGPRLPCASLADAYVVREGSTHGYGDWLLMLPGTKRCLWLYLVVSGSTECAESLKVWLAASVVGAQSAWDRFATGEAELLEEMRRQPQLTLSQGVKELIDLPKPGEQGSRGGWNSLRYEGHTPEGPLAPPRGDYADVLRQLGALRTGAMLLPHQTYRLHYRPGVVQIRLWDGQAFTRLRLAPYDWEHTIVLIQPQTGGPVLLQVPGENDPIYLDAHEHRAFRQFKDWVDYQRAHIRILRREFDRLGFRKLAPNVAPFAKG
jgi:hypothetical protein